VNILIIPAAGSGTRFGSAKPKQYLPLAGVPILARTVAVAEQCPSIDTIVIAADAQFHQAITAMIAEHDIQKPLVLVEGGSERQHSIFRALHTPEAQQADLIAIHDAVRPFITPNFVESLVAAARTHGAVVPGLMPKETVKEVDAAGSVQTTHNRSALRLIQTPQVFQREILWRAYCKAQEQHFLGTDDASVVEFAGYTVKVMEGLEANIKITTPADWTFAETLLQHR
jgi:2-C-methyl-D-erythritol 4-phosphate cytidylyltransferase